MEYRLITSLSQNSSSASRGIPFGYLFTLVEVVKEDYTLSVDMHDCYEDYYTEDLISHICIGDTWNIEKSDVTSFENVIELKEYLEIFLKTSHNIESLKSFFKLGSDILNEEDIYYIKNNIIFLYENIIEEETTLINEFFSKLLPNTIDPKDLKKAFVEIFQKYYQDNFYKFDNNNYVVHYPHVKITNSSGRSHDIYDLFVQINIRITNSFLNLAFLGTRTTLSKAELSASYHHSHLPGSSSFGNFAGFCLGEGHLKIYSKITSEDMLMTLPSSLDRYVEWESLEGGPYRNISSVSSRSASTRGVNLINDEIESFIRNAFLTNNVTIDISNTNITLYCAPRYSPDCFLLKIGNDHLKPQEFKIPEKLDNLESFTYSVKKSSLDLIKVSDNSPVKIYHKEIEKITMSLKKAEVVPYFSNFNILLQNNSVISTILNKYKNELIELE